MLIAAMPGDGPQVHAIEQAAQAQPWSAQAFVDSVAHGAQLWLWRESANIQAYLLLQTVLDEAEILNFAVHPQYQRQGVGRALLGHWLASTPAMGCQRVFLEVRASNVPAQRLYQSLGFVRSGCRPRYYLNGDGSREDAWMMQWLRPC